MMIIARISARADCDSALSIANVSRMMPILRVRPARPSAVPEDVERRLVLADAKD